MLSISLSSEEFKIDGDVSINISCLRHFFPDRLLKQGINETELRPCRTPFISRTLTVWFIIRWFASSSTQGESVYV